jgi:hypothetical protein
MKHGRMSMMLTQGLGVATPGPCRFRRCRPCLPYAGGILLDYCPGVDRLKDGPQWSRGRSPGCGDLHPTQASAFCPAGFRRPWTGESRALSFPDAAA